MYLLSVTVPFTASGDYGTDTRSTYLPTGTRRAHALTIADRAYQPGTIVRVWSGRGIHARVIYQRGQHPDWTPAGNVEGVQ